MRKAEHLKRPSRKPCPHPGPYHLTRDGLAIVKPHPQATTCFAREQGYLVMRIEPAYRDDGPFLVAALNVGTLYVSKE